MEADTKAYTICYDQSIEAVVMEWRGYSNSDEFREGTELMLNTLIQNKTFKVLADIKDMTLIGGDDQEWLDKVFLPRATDFGFKVMALVKPDHYFNKVAVDSIYAKADKNKLALHYFDNLQDAREWLTLV